MKQVQEGWSGSFSFSLSVLLADVPEGITPEDMSPEEKLVREEVTTAKEAINRSLISSLIGILNWAKQSGNDFVIKCVHYLFQSFAYQGSYTIFTDEQYTCLSLIVQSIPREKAAFLTTFFQEQAKRGTLVDLPDFDIEIDSQLEALHQYSSRVNNPTALKRKTTAPPKEDSESDDDTPPFIKALLQALNKRGLLEEESPPHTVLPLRVTTEGGFDRGVSSGSGSEVVSVASTKEGEETKEGKKTEESEKSGDSDGCKTQAVIPEFEDPSFSDVSTTSQGREGVILTTVLKKGRKEERINIIDDENNDEEDEDNKIDDGWVCISYDKEKHCIDLDGQDLTSFVTLTSWEEEANYFEITNEDLYTAQKLTFFVLAANIESIPKKATSVDENGDEIEVNALLIEDLGLMSQSQEISQDPLVRSALEPVWS